MTQFVIDVFSATAERCRQHPGRGVKNIITDMTPQEKAATGIGLIKEAILECLAVNEGGIGNAAIASKLGLQADPTKFTRMPTWNVLQQLEVDGQVRSEGNGKRRVYFAVKRG